MHYVSLFSVSLSLSLSRSRFGTARTTPIVLDFVTPNVETSPRFEAEVTGQYAKRGVVFNALNNGHLRSIIQLDKVYPSLHFRDRT